ncbi:UbiX family flavin prenyltransferase [Halosquirtibacter xylanolyticus]|uniref:UbiX family flavin prenyltransferase n=1 Tax=Halosquirtibacter xylanolyticus TaxID=3374599 RepID=UPI003748E63F|nr:UbiX family flavin prenyltransferase [Prolixibacteraceae bacterium]
MKIVVAITGASGAIYAQRLLKKIKALTPTNEVAVVFSSNAQDIWKYELKEPWIDGSYGVDIFDRKDFNAPFASGSSRYELMIIVPCSMGTLARISHGISDDLITRTADVMLKERRRLVIVPRETPYNLVHLRNMTSLTEMGAVIVPATPSFYRCPTTIEEVVDSVVDRIMSVSALKDEENSWGEGPMLMR